MFFLRLSVACLLSILLVEADGLLCFHCNLVDNPLQCHSTTACNTHEACHVTETIDDNFNLTYRLGCVAEQECSHLSRRFQDNRRSLSKQCCSTDLCNRGYPGLLTNNAPPTTSLQTTSSRTTTTTRPKTTAQAIKHTTNQHYTNTHDHHTNHTIDDRCPHGHTYDGYCYVPSIHYGHRWSQVTRHNADSYCRSHGMTLPSIHSQIEEAFIQRIMTKTIFWIGLQNTRWDDGTSFNFNRLDHNNYHSASNRHCIVMGKDMKWWAVGCDQHHYFLCKRKMDLSG
ncbi:uncharacterized protein LOC133201583 [Saccostrea echinata]|uniref:uncharacterized protein LOC133201583 n=1 Tax=Saccostrea echinata TaxID=191078 RepID=UPI002A80A93A|nr:uncharacterized protein LOC133201583 [Saccostrea echinata]